MTLEKLLLKPLDIYYIISNPSFYKSSAEFSDCVEFRKELSGKCVAVSALRISLSKDFERTKAQTKEKLADFIPIAKNWSGKKDLNEKGARGFEDCLLELEKSYKANFVDHLGESAGAALLQDSAGRQDVEPEKQELSVDTNFVPSRVIGPEERQEIVRIASEILQLLQKLSNNEDINIKYSINFLKTYALAWEEWKKIASGENLDTEKGFHDFLARCSECSEFVIKNYFGRISDDARNNLSSVTNKINSLVASGNAFLEESNTKADINNLKSPFSAYMHQLSRENSEERTDIPNYVTTGFNRTGAYVNNLKSPFSAYMNQLSREKSEKRTDNPNSVTPGFNHLAGVRRRANDSTEDANSRKIQVVDGDDFFGPTGPSINY